MIANVAAEITQTPAASPSTPSMKLITFITATKPSTVSTWPTLTLPSRTTSRNSTWSSWTPPTNGRVKSLTQTPLKTGIIAATNCPTSFAPAGRSKTSSSTPTAAITAAPPRIALVSGAQGRNRAPATRTPQRIARPPSLGMGTSCRPRSRGSSMAFSRRAAVSVRGTSSQAIDTATREGEDAVDRVGSSVNQHRDDLAARVSDAPEG